MPTPSAPPQFTLKDLLGWVELSVDALQAISPASTVREELGFEMALVASLCLAVPGVEVIKITARPVRDPATPMPIQVTSIGSPRMVARWNGHWIGRHGELDQREMEYGVMEACRDELPLHSFDRETPLEVVHHTLPEEDVPAFATGAWQRFLIAEISARKNANLDAIVLDRSTAPARAIAPPRRRM